MIFNLLLFFCLSLTHAEYVLYKYDGTDLSVQEHRQAYQILLEQQWPTAPAFNTKYNPEIDEEVEIAKRLKTEVPTVYARWIPRIVYECAVLAIFGSDQKSELYSFISPEKIPSFYKSPYDWVISDKDIIKLGRDVNLEHRFIEFHRLINEALRFILKNQQRPGEQLSDYYCRVISSDSVNAFDAFQLIINDAQEVLPSLIRHILKLELFLKNHPNRFFLWRAEDSLPERDFSIEQLNLLKNDLAALSSDQHVVINDLHVSNISYSASFLSGFITDPGASCFVRYFSSQLQDLPDDEGYCYALSLRKTDILNGTQLFGIPPLATLIGNFCSVGELFHPRAFTLLSNNKEDNEKFEFILGKMTKDHYGSSPRSQNDLGWCYFWSTDPHAIRLSYRLNSTNEVIKQAALRRQYIVENAIPLNGATKILIDKARAIYKEP